jgi:hypothetical protein
LRDAILFSTGANAHHGYRRSHAERRRRVRRVLKLIASWPDEEPSIRPRTDFD